MSVTTFYINDDRPDLTGVISVTGSTTVTGATATLSAAKRDGTLEIDDQSVTIDSVDESEDTIEWTYRIQDGNFNVVGLYIVWLTVTYSDGDVQTVAEDTNGNKNLVQVKHPYG